VCVCVCVCVCVSVCASDNNLIFSVLSDALFLGRYLKILFKLDEDRVAQDNNNNKSKDNNAKNNPKLKKKQQQRVRECI